jgi:hypothetical protein
VDDLSGTLGLAGSADYILVLRRQRNSNDANLQITGRDAPEGEYAFTIDGGAWTLSGEGLAAAAAEAQNRRETKNLGDRALEALAFVNAHPGGVSPEGLAAHLGISSNDAGTYLRRLYERQAINRPARGIYTSVSVSEVSEVSYLQVEGTETEDSLNHAVSEVSETEEQHELFDSTADDTSDTHHEQVSEVENVTYLHKETDSDTKDTSDSDTHQTVSEGDSSAGSRRFDWPSREDWEAESRRIAEWMVETGAAQGDDDMSFTAEDREAAEALAAVAVKQIRKACGEVERVLRAASPAAAAAADPKRWDYRTTEGYREWDAAVDALEGGDRDAYDGLQRMRDFRCQVKRMTSSYLTPYDIAVKFRWPSGFDHPASPEITRLAELVDGADERRAEGNREIGRRRLAALDAPDAWEEELKRREEIEAWFRDGPIVRLHHTDGTVTSASRKPEAES